MKPIPLRDYVVGGQVREDTVNAILACRAEPMVSDDGSTGGPARCFARIKLGDYPSRTFGPPAGTVQEAADGLLAKVRR